MVIYIILQQIMLKEMQKVRLESRYYETYSKCDHMFTNLDMSIVQAAFFDCFILFPELYGCR